MKPIEFIVDNHTITYQLNWLGIETILLNGKKISKKLSLGKRVCRFELLVHGTMQSFHIESKQDFNTGYVSVQLFQNGELIDTDYVTFFEGITTTASEPSKKDNSMFITGMMFIVLTLCFDWSKVFLFIGLMLLFSAVSNTKSGATSEENNTIEPKE